MKANLKKHEIWGLLLMFSSGTLLGFGLFLTFWGASRPLFFGSLSYLLGGRELIIFPVFYGLAFVLFALGQIELKEATPGGRRQ